MSIVNQFILLQINLKDNKDLLYCTDIDSSTKF